MSKYTLAKLRIGGFEYRIFCENTPVNQYRIIRRWWDIDRHGFRTQTMVRYGDYTSCLYWIAEEANLYGRTH